jgi:hypothetical protein
MKYLTLAVLIAILIGAIVYTLQHPDDLAPTAPSSGWNRR